MFTFIALAFSLFFLSARAADWYTVEWDAPFVHRLGKQWLDG